MKKTIKIPKAISEFSAKGGRTSSANMTPEERKERGRKAAAKRWEAEKEKQGKS